MQLNLKGFSALVAQHVAAVQAKFAGLASASVGSLNLALAEASGGTSLWLQALAFKLLLYARASTSRGTDLDSWVGQFGLSRLPPSQSVGSVTFGRYSAFAAATIVPVGANVATADNSRIFAVTAQTSHSSYSAEHNGYVFPANQAAITVPAICTSSGAGGNVLSGFINVVKTSISAVDYVTNGGAFSGGVDAETDEALRTRFVTFINSLSKGTAGAIGYAILSLRLGLQYQLIERQEYARPSVVKSGYFYVVFDDGTGLPSDTLRDQVYTAVEAVRAFGIEFSVFKPRIINNLISLRVKVADGYDKNTVLGQVYQAVYKYVNTLLLGAPLSYLRLAQVAFDASPGVVNVSNLLINGATNDVIATRRDVIKANTITVVSL